MTTLISWIAIDQRGPSSIYIASDSRISWSDPRNGELRDKWDEGRKVFASSTSPDIFGFCGHVDFASHVLGQLLSHFDSGNLCEPGTNSDSKVHIIDNFIQKSLGAYPISQTFQLLYCSRDGEGMMCQFKAYLLKYGTGVTQIQNLQFPARSGCIHDGCVGSGYRNGFRVTDRTWQASEIGGTSRAVFRAFCDHLARETDPMSGGAPQLAGLYRIGAGHSFATVYRGQAYLHATPIPRPDSSIEFRNENFERCDPNSLTRIHTAQIQPRPNSLRK